MSDVLKNSVMGDPANEGVIITDDVHGLYTFEEKGKPARLSMRGSFTVEQSSERVCEATSAIAAQSIAPNSEQALACDLVSLSEHENSNRTKFLLIVTAMESLAERAERIGPPRLMVDEYIEEVKLKELKLARSEGLESLLGGLEDLRQESISGAIRRAR